MTCGEDSVGLPSAGKLKCVDMENRGSHGFRHHGSVCTSGEGPGLQNQFAKSATSNLSIASDTDEKDLAFCLALLARKSTELALIVERWYNLPLPVRAGIVAMVQASEPG